MILEIISFGVILVVIGGVILKIKSSCYCDDSVQPFDYGVYNNRNGRNI